ncbi:subtilisin-like protease-like [Hibiscus syriacus]|uniref:Subtilisin-like protease-like n=1 Tax=Hibiscus syriacus TaxID=106335 RepID=A0A6A2YCE7_HIBSY|nr:protein NCA1-like [Hibiscus syriacus]KAE8670637.1 subtilisin-like protease-like [Hibiscus syriacus]
MTTPVCPFVKAARPDDACPAKNASAGVSEAAAARKDPVETATVSPKCPFGYDSSNFKLGPLSCMICHALLFDSTKCIPCSHLFCQVCISRFKDCPLCGADIEKLEADTNLQSMVDRFIKGHARIKRPHVDANGEGKQVVNEDKKVIYEDVSLDRGAFLVQQAMRAFRAQNFRSAKSRLTMCAEDIQDQLEKTDDSSELYSQLGAVLGMLGDCCRAMGDSAAAINYFEESVEFLTKLPANHLEITHTLSVSLNKIGDLKYYNGDLQGARSYYLRSLGIRRDVVKNHPGVASEILDVAISLAKVADVERTLGKEDEAVDGFEEAIKLLESLSLKSEEAGLEPRRLSVLAFLKTQLEEKQSEATASSVTT